MRTLAIIFTTIALVSCSKAPIPRTEPQNARIDSVVQFLLTSAATDFHTHGPSPNLRFRDVYVRHVISSREDEQYMLCGQFLSEKEGNTGEWTPFTTIKTSGYEQWLGAQAVGFCQNASVIPENEGDLSSLLQSRFDSLK